jgi:PAS domain-containing protein
MSLRSRALVWHTRCMNTLAPANPYKRHHFPSDIISHCIWLYFRFYLSYRDIEEMMAARGVILTYEAVRYWCRKFGQVYAHQLRRRCPSPGGKWHLDEVFLTILHMVPSCHTSVVHRRVGKRMSKPDIPAWRVAATVLRYGLSAFSVAISLSVTLLVQPYVFRTPLVFPSIMPSTWVGGTGPGLLAVLLATLSLHDCFLDPQLTLACGSNALPHLIVVLLSALLVRSWSAAHRRAEQELRQARDELDAKVAELREAEAQLRLVLDASSVGTWTWEVTSNPPVWG